jgi:hypothetical protein
MPGIKKSLLGSINSSLVQQVERKMANRKLGINASIYDHLTVDIERILSVIPAKIRVQEKLEEANKTIVHLRARIS